MAKIISIQRAFPAFLAEMKESFWGDVYDQAKLVWQGFLEFELQRQRDRFSGWGRYEGGSSSAGIIVMAALRVALWRLSNSRAGSHSSVALILGWTRLGLEFHKITSYG